MSWTRLKLTPGSTRSEALGRLDVPVNNAGPGTPTMPAETIPSMDWDQTVASSLKTAFLCTRVTAPVMKRQGHGRIVNVSSFAGRNHSRISGPHCSAAKAGVIGLTKYIAVELGPFGIGVNSAASGAVLTARVKAKWEARLEDEQ